MRRRANIQSIRPEWPFCINRDSPQAQGLVGWWPLGFIQYEQDLTGNGSILTATGSPTLIYDYRLGPGKTFSGAGQAYSGNSLVTGSAYPSSMSCWTIPTGAASDLDIMVIQKSSASEGEMHAIRYAGAGIHQPYQTTNTGGSGGSLAQVSVGMTNGSLYNLCATMTSATLRNMYLNGGNKATDTNSRTPSGINEVDIGAGVGSSLTRAYPGSIFDARLYNVALTDSQIAAWFSDPRQSIDLYYKLGRRLVFLTATPQIYNISSDFDASIEQTNDINKTANINAIEPSIRTEFHPVSNSIIISPTVGAYEHVRVFGYNTFRRNSRTSIFSGNLQSLLSDFDFYIQDQNDINLILSENAIFDIKSEEINTLNKIVDTNATYELKTEESVSANLTNSFVCGLSGIFNTQISTNKIAGIGANYDVLLQNSANLVAINSILSNFSVFTEQSGNISRVANLPANYAISLEVSNAVNKIVSEAANYDLILAEQVTASRGASLTSDYDVVCQALGNTNLIASLTASNSLVFIGFGTFGGIASLLVDLNSVFGSQAATNTIKGFSPSFDLKTESVISVRATYNVNATPTINTGETVSTNLILGTGAAYGIIIQSDADFGSRVFVSAEISGVISAYVQAAKTAGLSSVGEVVFLSGSTFNLARPVIADLNISLQENAAINKSANIISNFSVFIDSDAQQSRTRGFASVIDAIFETDFALRAGVSLIVDSNLSGNFELATRVNLVSVLRSDIDNRFGSYCTFVAEAGIDILFVYEVTYYMKPLNQEVYRVVEEVEKTLPVVHDLFTTFKVKRVQE